MNKHLSRTYFAAGLIFGFEFFNVTYYLTQYIRLPPVKKYYLIGGLTAFVVIFNLSDVFHEIIVGSFFKETIGPIQRETYIIPLIALAFILHQ